MHWERVIFASYPVYTAAGRYKTVYLYVICVTFLKANFGNM